MFLGLVLLFIALVLVNT